MALKCTTTVSRACVSEPFGSRVIGCGTTDTTCAPRSSSKLRSYRPPFLNDSAGAAGPLASVLRPPEIDSRYRSSGRFSANRSTTWFSLGKSSTATMPTKPVGVTLLSSTPPNVPSAPARTMLIAPNVAGSIRDPGLKRIVICCGASRSVAPSSMRFPKLGKAATKSKAMTRLPSRDSAWWIPARRRRTRGWRARRRANRSRTEISHD